MNFKKKFTTTAILAMGLFALPAVQLNTSQNLAYIETVYAKSQEVEALSSRIEALPSLEDVQESDAKEVVALVKMYEELSMADKIEVPNYEKLESIYNKLIGDGVITNEEKETIQEQEIIKQEQEKKEVSNKDVEAQTQEYVFDIDDTGMTTVIVRFTSDSNGDGKNDIPDRIILTSPEGNTYPISNTSVTMQDGDIMKINLTWTSNFLQLDFSKAMYGRWSINTSEPVTCSQTPYAGAMKEIKPENKKEEDSAEVPELDEEGNVVDPNKEAEEDEGGGLSIMDILIPIVLIGGIITMIVLMKKNKQGQGDLPGGMSKKNKGKANNQANAQINIPMPDDDISEEDLIKEMKMMQAQNNESAKDENIDSFSNSFDFNEKENIDQSPSEYNSNNAYSNNSFASDNEFGDIQEYKESGDTGLLNKDDSPFNGDNGDDFDEDFSNF